MSTGAEKAHSPWGASGAHRWMRCPGVVRLSRQVPRAPDSIYADEGTVAHYIGEQCLAFPNLRPHDFVGKTLKGKTHEFEVTEEMADAVEVYVKAVRGDQLVYGGTVRVEQAFTLNDLIRDPVLDLWGTNDAYLLTREGTLIVYDYKHGRGHAVEVDNNPQLLYYALGAVLALPKGKVKDVQTVIVQPRAPHPDGPVRRYNYDLLDVLGFAADLEAAARATLAPDAPLRTGDHCLFCPAMAACPAQHAEAQALARMDFADLETVPPAPESLTKEQLVQVLHKADLVEDFIAATRAYAHNLLTAGHDVPGFKLVAKRPQRKYAADENTVFNTVRQLGLTTDEAYADPELRSVAQMESVLKKSGCLENDDAKAKWQSLWKKESSGTVLAPLDDPREPVTPTAIADFGDLI